MRIAVAMSGGVDSSLAAVLLKKEGHDVIGLTAKLLLCSEMDGAQPRFDVCCSPENIADAKAIAKKFGFPHILIDIEEDFSREIIEPFCDQYLRGRTPSPCLHCNARIKFKSLFARARELGCEKLATGHYARIGFENGRFFIAAARDDAKDQSYFLSMLDQEVLSAVIFPLGEHRKEETRNIASAFNLEVAHKVESQEICFVPDNDYAGYIERRRNIIPKAGNIVDENGHVLGTHRGIHRYTIGQRRGLGIAHSEPLYVIDIRTDANEIVVGPRERLKRRGLFARDINHMKSTRLDGRAYIKTRSTQRAFPGSVSEANGGFFVYFDEPIESITPGQAAVLYDESGAILGAGWIERAID